MRFIYGKQDFKTKERCEENCYLMTNGLGGFSSLTMAGSCTRNDHALLMSCKASEAPNHRYNMIHRLEEKLIVGGQEVYLSTQEVSGHNGKEEGYRYLSSFVFEDFPIWRFLYEGVEISKKAVMLPGKNRIAISWTIENRTQQAVTYVVVPHMEFVAKGTKLDKSQSFKSMEQDGKTLIQSNGQTLQFITNGKPEYFEPCYHEDNYYSYDVCDGRAETGCTACNHQVFFEIPAGKILKGVIVYDVGTDLVGSAEGLAEEAEDELIRYRSQLRSMAHFNDETACTLAAAANQFIAYKASTGNGTILAGFPFFEDWGRDTMIALTGCCMSVGQIQMAESILRTFMKYCRKGLMPNLFPEGTQEPRYNTVDAALLFVIAVYEFYERTGNKAFVREAWPVMREIVTGYCEGTDYSIGMDEDGLIYAGEGYDQVTWMDVRIGDILPTPRHGKPVEINAYWYNVLCIMDYFNCMDDVSANSIAKIFRGADYPTDYRAMAEKTRRSFQNKFWDAEKKCLKDVLSRENSEHDNQLRCNQIWAVSLPFSVLEREQELLVVEAVFRKLYTPLGLRTLEVSDPEFQPFYGGSMMKRDLAYHQGTVWVFPLGGYYLAYLKVHDYSEEARQTVKEQLQGITTALREGCIGQLPEIYDGLYPTVSKGCFAQAWSVGEILRVYEALEKR